MSGKTRAALFVEHAQNDWMHPEGVLAKTDHRHLAEHIQKLVHAPGFTFRVLTETHLPADSKFLASNHPGKQPGEQGDIPNPKNPAESTKLELLPQCSLRGSWGAQTIDEITPGEFDFVLEKFTHPDHLTLSSFKDMHGNWHADMADGALSHDLEAELKKNKIDTVVVVGCHGEHCVPHTAIDSHALGYRSFIVKDAIAFHDEECNTDAFWADLRAKGINCVTMGDPALTKIMKGE